MDSDSPFYMFEGGHMKGKPIPDWKEKEATYTDDSLIVDGHQVMMDWETPIMHKMAGMLHQYTAGDILEVGFGMGISATEIVKLGVKSYTVIEPHPDVYQRALAWKDERPDTDITLIQGFWQSSLDDLDDYDGIFFDTFSATREEIEKKRFDFFRAASARLLRRQGALTFFYWNPRLELHYQDQLFSNFSEVRLERLEITPPEDCNYAEDIDGAGYTLCALAIK